MLNNLFLPAALLLLAYLLGSIPWGYLIGRYYHKDIRELGSKNIGATNVTRCIGPWQGRLCFLLDFLKGALPMLVTVGCGGLPGWVPLGVVLCAVLGHIFPVFLSFKGGKGISTAAGAIVVLAPWPLLVALAIWVVIFLISRYVSLASIAAAVALPVVAFAFQFAGVGTEKARSWPTIIFLVFVAALAVYRHRANIHRLLNGEENRFGRRRQE